MSDLKIQVSTSVTSSKTEKPAEVKEEKAPEERIKTPDIISSQPAPAEATVTTVKEETRRASASTLTPKMSDSSSKISTRTTTTRSSAIRTTDYESNIGQLTKDYRGTSPAVLEGIASQPILYSKAFDKIGNTRLSARSRKILRDTTDLALVAPGLKNLLEVGFTCLIVLQSSYVAMCCFGLIWLSTECKLLRGKVIIGMLFVVDLLFLFRFLCNYWNSSYVFDVLCFV